MPDSNASAFSLDLNMLLGKVSIYSFISLAFFGFVKSIPKPSFAISLIKLEKIVPSTFNLASTSTLSLKNSSSPVTLSFPIFFGPPVSSALVIAKFSAKVRGTSSILPTPTVSVAKSPIPPEGGNVSFSLAANRAEAIALVNNAPGAMTLPALSKFMPNSGKDSPINFLARASEPTVSIKLCIPCGVSPYLTS